MPLMVAGDQKSDIAHGAKGRGGYRCRTAGCHLRWGCIDGLDQRTTFLGLPQMAIIQCDERLR